MTKDLQSVALLDTVPISSLQLVSLSPVVFVLRGGPYNKVFRVLFDGVESPMITIRDDATLLAQVPSSKLGNLFRTVSVVASEFSGAPSSVVLYECEPWLVGGLFKLLQQYVTLLLTTPGTDRFHPTRGGGLKILIGTTPNTLDVSYVLTFIASAVDRCAQDIINSQGTRALDPSERLASVELFDIRYHRPTLGYKVLLRLTAASQAGLEFGLGVENG